jgi:hypothetical protein
LVSIRLVLQVQLQTMKYLELFLADSSNGTYYIKNFSIFWIWSEC